MNEDQDRSDREFLSGTRRRTGCGVSTSAASRFPNSICFSVDGRTMYFCDSAGSQDPSGDCDLIDAAAVLAKSGSSYASAMTRGSLMGRSLTGKDACGMPPGAWAWSGGSSDGRLLGEIKVPSKNTTCLVFGGDALSDIYITSSRQEMSAEELNATPV